MTKEIEIPEGYEARIEGNKVILEPKESEDERIRKMLIEQMERWKKCAEDDNVEQDVKDASAAIAYLEKQKEQKPIFKKGDTLKKKGKEYTFTIDKIQGGFYLTKDEHFFPIEEQDTWELVEQKPAGWSEEDEEMKARVIRRYTDYEGVIMRTKEESIAAKMLNAMMQEEAWLHKSLRPQPNWKPSEEQINALQAFVGMINPDARYNEVLSLLDDLQKLL